MRWLSPTKVNFSAQGVGAQGLKEYKFTLDLFNDINVDKVKSVLNDNKVDLFLPKKAPAFWERLVSETFKSFVYMTEIYDKQFHSRL